MKLFYRFACVLFFATTIVSCSNDDDPVVPELNFEEKIVGTWQLTGREPNGIEVCELSNTIEFSQEGNVFIEIFIGDTPENCQSASRSGTWAYLGDRNIEVDFAGVEENTILKILFFDNFTGLKISSESSERVETYAKQ